MWVWRAEELEQLWVREVSAVHVEHLALPLHATCLVSPIPFMKSVCLTTPVLSLATPSHHYLSDASKHFPAHQHNLGHSHVLIQACLVGRVCSYPCVSSDSPSVTRRGGIKVQCRCLKFKYEHIPLESHAHQ
jgi:hypothetical protein